MPRTFPKPLVAAINGACAGVGLVQALFCHVRFAADTARFSTAFARRGLIAEYGIAWTLPRLVGLENALDLLLSARTFDAAEAKELGLVSRVVPREDVLSAAQEYARDIAGNCAPSAVAVIAAQVLEARMARRHLRRRAGPRLRRDRQAHRHRRHARGHRVVAGEATAAVPAAVPLSGERV